MPVLYFVLREKKKPQNYPLSQSNRLYVPSTVITDFMDYYFKKNLEVPTPPTPPSPGIYTV